MAEIFDAHHTTCGSMMEMGSGRNFSLLGGFHTRVLIFKLLGNTWVNIVLLPDQSPITPCHDLSG
jgi:hypothetical protein